MAGSLTLQQFTATQISQEEQRGVLILDTRPAELFAAAHIRGAMQLGLMGPFASWAAILIAPTQRLLIVAEDEASVQESRIRLARVGLEHIAGFTLADENQWRHHGIRLASLPIHRCEDVCRNQQEGRKHQLIDVRSSAEWLKGHLPGAISLPLLELNLKAASIDFSRPSLVYCREGYRAATAASLLLRGNARDVGILIDAMDCIDRPRPCGVSSGTSLDGLEASSLVHL
jgi:rhodanese-related sulfurtransferase